MSSPPVNSRPSVVIDWTGPVIASLLRDGSIPLMRGECARARGVCREWRHACPPRPYHAGMLTPSTEMRPPTAWSSQGDVVAVGIGTRVRMFRTDTGQEVPLPGMPGHPDYSVASLAFWDDDASLAAVYVYDTVFAHEHARNTMFVRVQSLDRLRPTSARMCMPFTGFLEGDVLADVTLAPDGGRVLATARNVLLNEDEDVEDYQCTMYAWELRGGQDAVRFSLVRRVVFEGADIMYAPVGSPDGSAAAVVAWDGDADNPRVFVVPGFASSAPAWVVRATTSAHPPYEINATEGAESVVWSADSRHLVLVVNDHMRIVDLEDHDGTNTQLLPARRAVRAPRGVAILSSDRLTLLDPRGGNIAVSFARPAGNLNVLSLSPDGRAVLVRDARTAHVRIATLER